VVKSVMHYAKCYSLRS